MFGTLAMPAKHLPKEATKMPCFPCHAAIVKGLHKADAPHFSFNMALGFLPASCGSVGICHDGRNAR